MKGEQKAGYTTVSLQEETEAKLLAVNTSAQKAKLIALTQALELSERKRAQVYTDSKYAFGIIQAHGAI